MREQRSLRRGKTAVHFKGSPALVGPAAWVEVEEAFDYYAERSRRAAENFREALDGAVERVAENGETYPIFDDDARRCLLDKYPFGIDPMSN